MSKYPNIKIDLGTQENAIDIINICSNAAKESNIKQNVIDEFVIEATSHDYLNLVDTCEKWFEVTKEFIVYRPKQESSYKYKSGLKSEMEKLRKNKRPKTFY